MAAARNQIRLLNSGNGDQSVRGNPAFCSGRSFWRPARSETRKSRLDIHPRAPVQPERTRSAAHRNQTRSRCDRRGSRFWDRERCSGRLQSQACGRQAGDSSAGSHSRLSPCCHLHWLMPQYRHSLSACCIRPKGAPATKLGEYKLADLKPTSCRHSVWLLLVVLNIRDSADGKNYNRLSRPENVWA